jgi:predicted TIM-barrel enzyme
MTPAPATLTPFKLTPRDAIRRARPAEAFEKERGLIPERTVFTRESILARLRKSIAEGRPILGAGSSVGIVAKSAEAGGADLIIVYSTGRSRIFGLPTTMIGHSNPLTLDMFDEIANVVDDTPIIGGAEAVDPTYRRLPKLIEAFRDKGFDGLINFPTVGNRPDFSETRAHVGQGFDRELEMVSLARKQDYLTLAYVWNPEQARQMAAAGVDVQVPHVGWTVGGLSGAGSLAMSLDVGCENVQKMIDATWKENPDVICMAHGGPLATPDDTKVLYEKTDAQGFVGASSLERIPIEQGVMNAARGFKDQTLRASARKR